MSFEIESPAVAAAREKLAETTQRIAAATTAEDAAAIRIDLTRTRRVIESADDKTELHVLLVDLAEAQARAMRREGELSKPQPQGARNDLRNKPATSDIVSEVAETDAARKRAGRYRAIANLPIDAFEGALAGARASGEPITQSALLKLVPKPPKDRQVSHLAWLAPFLEKTAKKIRKRLSPDGEPPEGTPEAMDTGEVASLIEELARRVDARREDPNSKQIDLSNLVGPPPGDDEDDQDDQDNEDDGDESSFDANDGTEGV